MPTQEYNQWDAGISQDDVLTTPGQYIEWKNMDWLRTGYGITLWPKVTKEIETNYKITGFLDWSDEYVWTENGEIYNLDTATDLTPSYTLVDEPTY